ncbi:nuclear transport factor 2 family protein [Nocardiopsis sp. HNM0947]|uniref:Nuclear transport factor 2 family protein n=1 Tax=Nocardiopsis coralli TaxID=2772213 RepID=A0ABR9NZZ5_9ACTN|nr:nuclear transport factor 2 family protein [Nocardiopsis coralli]MBE2997110.1 nuclear transport factor 2 family protein [Nocardiopsis coralli]
MTGTDRLARIEARLQSLEDERDITRLILSYGPLVDSGDADGVAGLWTDDGFYDVDTLRMDGRAQIAAMVRSAPHRAWIEGGCAHLSGPPHVVVDGDRAVAVCHSLLVVHGDGGFRVQRATANRWDLCRTSDGWKVAERTGRVLDGREVSPALLHAGVRAER